ncbi:MAG: hypothetical protein ACFFCW_24080 [Candidatus Hodarchaeota archaeon]
MAKKKGMKDRVEGLIEELIRNELQAQLSKMVWKARKRAVREAGKLNEIPQLEYHKDQGFIEAEVIENSQTGEVKKTASKGQG